MRRLIFKMTLPTEMFSELEAAAAQCKCSPAEFVAQSIEALLASRRLRFVAPAKLAPRVPGHVAETTMRHLSAEYRDAGPMSPADIPSTADLDVLAVIT